MPPRPSVVRLEGIRLSTLETSVSDSRQLLASPMPVKFTMPVKLGKEPVNVLVEKYKDVRCVRLASAGGSEPVSKLP